MSDIVAEVKRELSRSNFLRGDFGYGRKPSRGLLRSMASGTGEPVTIVHADGPVLRIETISDPNPVIQRNKELLASGDDGYNPSRDFRRVASIPPGVVVQWYREGINPLRNEDWPKVAARLDDPQWWFLRTAPGKVSRRPVRHYPTEGYDRRGGRA